MLPAYVKNLFLLSLLSLLGVVSGLFFYGRNCLLPDFDTLARHSYDMPSLVLDSQGKELFRFELEHRTPVSLTQVSPHLINAFVAAEDRQFFAHRGVSWRGILRALWINVRARRVSQGAST
ncbi:MAG: Penicillin-binding protein, 1A family, partial [candidate division TM6 bacterium GW2011_GWF2_43_17]